jgi:hypothetical protein
MKESIVNFSDGETALLLQIKKLLKSIRYGYVQIIIQDSKPVQIDKVEKFRLDKQGGGG